MVKNHVVLLAVKFIAAAAATNFVYVLMDASGSSRLDLGAEREPHAATSSLRAFDSLLAPTRELGPPTRLVIPRLGIDAGVQAVGLTPSGAMGVPTNYADVGWYKHGPAPGEEGSAVIAGHVDNALGLGGVFKNLAEVEPGDNIIVITDQGKTIKFKVENLETFYYQETPEKEIFAAGGEASLRLITCGGNWVKRDQTYDTRLVVTARFAGEQ